MLLECVVNVSEGRDEAVLDRLAAAAGPALLDRHRDPDHNRTVFTLVGPVDLVAEASRALAAATLAPSTCAGTPVPTPGSACSTWCPSSPTSPAARRPRTSPSP